MLEIKIWLRFQGNRKYFYTILFYVQVLKAVNSIQRAV